jgi:hypothetical protein
MMIVRDWRKLNEFLTTGFVRREDVNKLHCCKLVLNMVNWGADVKYLTDFPTPVIYNLYDVCEGHWPIAFCEQSGKTTLWLLTMYYINLLATTGECLIFRDFMYCVRFGVTWYTTHHRLCSETVDKDVSEAIGGDGVIYHPSERGWQSVLWGFLYCKLLHISHNDARTLGCKRDKWQVNWLSIWRQPHYLFLPCCTYLPASSQMRSTVLVISNSHLVVKSWECGDQAKLWNIIDDLKLVLGEVRNTVKNPWIEVQVEDPGSTEFLNEPTHRLCISMNETEAMPS